MDIIEILKVIFLGIVEGITEWLPISSTGHMILVDEFLQLNQDANFKEMFFVVIQLGAILAVVVMFFGKLWPFKKPDKTSEQKLSWIKMDTMTMWFKVIVAVLPAMIIGLPLDDWFEANFHNFGTVSLMLIIYGVLFIVIENWNKKRTPVVLDLNSLTFKQALLIGLFQVLSLIPGTSRSGSTILGGILIGTSRYVAAEFSFFLAIPVMVGASGYKFLKFGLETGFAMTADQIIILVLGMVVAFVVSIFVIKFLMDYIKKKDFKVFGYYRIILGVILLGYMCFFK